MKESYYIFINKNELVKGEVNAGRIYGSIKEMVEEKIIIKNKELNYDALKYLLRNDKYFNNSDYYIKKTMLKRSKMTKK